MVGNEKGRFNSGINFTIDEDGSLLNIRGLEKINSTGNPQVIEISDLSAIINGKGGGSLVKKMPNIGIIENGQKAVEQAENAINQIIKQINKSKLASKKAVTEAKNENDSVVITT